MISHDNSTRIGFQGRKQAGIGLAYTKHCLPDNHFVGQQRGGKTINYLGGRVWCCAWCVAARAGRVAV